MNENIIQSSLYTEVQERTIFKKLNNAIKKLTPIFGDEFLFGIFCYGTELNIEAIVIPSFEDICINAPLIYTVIDDIVVKDIRRVYNATKAGDTELIEGLYTNYYIVTPRYEFLYEKLLRNNRDIIAAGVESGEEAEELKIALVKILRTAWNDTSNAVRFIKQLTEGEKVGLQGIIDVIGDEGIVSQAKIASTVGVSRLTLTNLVQKMKTHGVANVEFMGVKGTYIKFIDATLLNIRGENNL